jgi:hypothetical protein
LIPSKKNQITYLTYTNTNNEVVESPNTHILDDIRENWSKKYENSQSYDRDKYNFAKFFSNSYGTRNDYVNNNDDTQELEFPTPPEITESVAVQTIKRSLLSSNAPLNSIDNFMNISYKYLILDRINNEYVARIFPSEFITTYASESSKRNRITGLFE